MKTLLLVGLVLAVAASRAAAQAADNAFAPPWNPPLTGGVSFTVPGIDNAADLYGDVNDPDLVVFFAGNQFMVLDDLLAAFRRQYPQYRRIFVETLPPGILADQVRQGALITGNLRVSLKPDVFADGQPSMAQKQDWFTRTAAYARNQLTIMVRAGNPKHIRGLADLGRADVRVSMPNPAFEGVGTQIEAAYRNVGGPALEAKIMEAKVKDHSTYLTRIHHRETPLRLLRDESDAGPVWYSEAFYQHMIGHPIGWVELPPADNVVTTYVAGSLKTAPHPEAAAHFLAFL
ncbi:MAG TPA: substrate-binding domain-containing protein, partial [Cytophagales bacterium]